MDSNPVSAHSVWEAPDRETPGDLSIELEDSDAGLKAAAADSAGAKGSPQRLARVVVREVPPVLEGPLYTNRRDASNPGYHDQTREVRKELQVL